MNLNGDRVRAHTASAVLQRIDDDAAATLEAYADADPDEIGRRLRELDHEWDTDRAIELEAAITGLAGLLLGTLVRPALLAVPAVVGAAVLLQAATGAYPMLPLFRRAGLRTAREIARERYALKALRGDFDGMAEAGADGRAKAVDAAGDAPSGETVSHIRSSR